MKPIYLVPYGKPKLLLCHAAEYDIIITEDKRWKEGQEYKSIYDTVSGNYYIYEKLPTQLLQA